MLAVWSAAGDAAAFAELYRRWFRRIAAHLHRRGIDPAEVDDLAQEVFTTALELLHEGLFPEGEFRTWLFGHVVPRTLTGYFGTRWRRDKAVAGVTLAASIPGPEATAPPGLPDRYAAAVATLTLRQRQLVELRYIEGQSIAATMLITGLSESGVRAGTERAVRDLYTALTGTARPRRPAAASLDALLPTALEIARQILADGGRWSVDALETGFRARGIPLGSNRAGALARMVRQAMPQTGTGRENRLVRRMTNGGAR